MSRTRVIWSVAAVVVALACVLVGQAAGQRSQPGAPDPTSPRFQSGEPELMLEDKVILLYEPGVARQLAPTWKRMGVDSSRIQIPWDAVNPSPTRYNWGVVDQAVATLKSAGIAPILTLPQYGPGWSRLKGRNRFSHADPADFAKFARAAAARYRRDVQIYLIGNEPNQRPFQNPQSVCRGTKCDAVAASNYRDVFNAAYRAIKSADSSSKVIIGELAPIGSGSRTGSLKPLKFIRRLACLDDKYKPIRDGSCKNFKAARADGFGFHPYNLKQRPDQPSKDRNLARIGDLPRFFTELDKVQRTGRLRASTGRFNLYLTEFAYETNPPDPAAGVSPALQNLYLQQSAYLAWAAPRVKLFSQYEWRDEPVQTIAGFRYGNFQSGLFFHPRVRGGAAKPSFAEFPHAFWVDTTRGLTRTVFWGHIRPGGQHQLRIEQRRGPTAAWQTFRTLRTTNRGYFNLTLPSRANNEYRYVYDGGAGTSGCRRVVRAGDTRNC